MRRKIGIVSAGWNDEYQRSIVMGITESCKTFDYDTLSFTSNNIDYTADEINRCGYNIYNLVNQTHLDGLILIVNTIYYQDVIHSIFEYTKTMKIPIVCIDSKQEGMMYVGKDNYSSARIMVKHLTDDSSRQRIGCITGVSFNPESELREKAFQDVMTEERGGYDNNYIYEGNFQYQCGLEAALYWQTCGKPYPDAVFCANDASARGFLHKTLEFGYRVPEDVKIVGFDNTFNGRYCRIPISSMDCALEVLGRRTIEMLKAYFDGSLEKTEIEVTGIPYFRESSGCQSEFIDLDYSLLYKKITKKTKIDEQYLFWANLMTERFSTCETIDELLEKMKPFIEQLRCECFYVCFTKEQMTTLRKGLIAPEGDRVGYMLEGYPSHMYASLRYVEGKYLEPEFFCTGDMLPDIEKEHSNRVDYVFFPFFFKGKTLGYCVVGNCNTMAYNVSFQTWLAILSYAVNNVFLHQKLAKQARELEEIHVRDSLTGVYNRLGFAKYSTPMMQECIRKKGSMMVLFADMDDMKYINDRFGHEEGDRAICAVSSLLSKTCQRGEIVFRFGGDEMVVFATDYDRPDVEDYIARFEQNLAEYNKTNVLYELRVSIGYDVFWPDETTSMDKCINSADANMYQEKYRRKKYATRER